MSKTGRKIDDGRLFIYLFYMSEGDMKMCSLKKKNELHEEIARWIYNFSMISRFQIYQSQGKLMFYSTAVLLFTP